MYGDPKREVTESRGYVNEGPPQTRFLGEEYKGKEVSHMARRKHKGHKMRGHRRGRKRSMV
jgi:hypothetical protein